MLRRPATTEIEQPSSKGRGTLRAEVDWGSVGPLHDTHDMAAGPVKTNCRTTHGRGARVCRKPGGIAAARCLLVLLRWCVLLMQRVLGLLSACIWLLGQGHT